MSARSEGPVEEVLLALYGYGFLDGTQLLVRKLASLGRALLYGGMGLAAAQILWGVRGDSNDATRAASAVLLSQWYGPPLLLLAGAVVVAIGGMSVWRGATRSFVKHDLQGNVPSWAVALGSVGWVAKGVTLLLVGIMLWVAVWTNDPGASGSLDQALKAIAGQPYGQIALVVVAAGFAAFGAYCLVWAFNARHDASTLDPQQGR